MANKVYNLNGGLYSGDAFTAFETRIASSNNGSIVASPSDLKVSAGSGMNVTVATGAGIIGNGTLSGVRFAIDAPVTVAVNAASTANPRMDSVVAYIDKSVSASTSVVDNTGLGIIKFKSVAGTPASTPTAPSASAIQSSIGAGNPYMVLANVTVPKSSSAASSFKIADMRVTPTSAIITDNSITTPKLANKAVTSDKVDWTTFDGSWHNITLYSGMSVGNANFIHSNNRWRYENGGRDIRIQLNVGNSNGTQVPAGQSKDFASPSQFSFMPSGKFMRLCGSGQASALVWAEINNTSSPFVRFTPITGASPYCALDVLIPKP